MNKLVVWLGVAIILIGTICFAGTLCGTVIGFGFPVPGRLGIGVIIAGVIVGLIGNWMKS